MAPGNHRLRPPRPQGAPYSSQAAAAAESAVAALAQRGWSVATAESCTGGLIAHLITEVPGASAHFGLGVVSYANEAKRDVLGVEEEVLGRHGAVSRATVEQMARGVRARGHAEIGIAVSGIAGPDGGTPDKPVGTVHFALASASGTQWIARRFRGTRSQVKLQAAAAALELVRRHCEGQET